MLRIAVVLLVDARGRVLLQERDEHAPIAAGPVGDGRRARRGRRGLRPGRAYRELEEETGIRLQPGDLTLWRETEFSYSDGHRSYYRVYAGTRGPDRRRHRARRGPADRLRRPGPTSRDLDLAESCAHFLPLFLASDRYRRLAEGASMT